MASHTLAPFPEELLAAKKQIRERSRSYGLDFFPVLFSTGLGEIGWMSWFTIGEIPAGVNSWVAGEVARA